MRLPFGSMLKYSGWSLPYFFHQCEKLWWARNVHRLPMRCLTRSLFWALKNACAFSSLWNPVLTL